MKFKDAYCTSSNKLVTIEEITYLYKFEKKTYKDKIENCLVCPQCKKPHLAYNNAATPYFSTFPNSRHEDGCELAQDEMSANQVKRLVSNSDNDELIVRQMDSILTMLLDNNNSPPNDKKRTAPTGKKATNSNAQKSNNGNSKRIPRKNLNSDFSEEDCDCYKIFYGHVGIRWEKVSDPNDKKIIKQYRLLVYKRRRNNHRMICRLNISPKVYSYLPSEYKKVKRYDCNIVFLSQFKDQGKSYYTAYLKNSKFLKIE